MKKIIRISAFLLAAVMICLSFTGCNALDRAKERQGFWDEDGNIRIGNTTYIELPYSDSFNPIFVESDKTYNVTEKDVPVLLSYWLGTEFKMNDDKTLLISDNYYFEDTFSSGYYCREDMYDEIVKIIEEGFTPNGYCYTYYQYDLDEDDYIAKSYQFTEEDLEAFTTVLEEIEPSVLPSGSSPDGDCTVVLEACSSNMMFKEDSPYELMKSGMYMYVVEYDGLDIMLYEVPSKLESVFEKILKPALEAEEDKIYADYDD